MNGKYIKITRPCSQAMDYYLNNYHSKGALRIPKTVYVETGHSIWDVATEKGSKLGFSATKIRYLADLALKRFKKLEDSIIEDDITKLGEVRKMYSIIWKDTSKSTKISQWASFKHKKISEGPPQGSDEIILSTAAKLIDHGQVELLTFDHDFIIFSDEIQKTFCVDVKDAGTIPN